MSAGAFEVPLFKPGVQAANSDLTSSQYCAVEIAGEQLVDLPAAAGDSIYGVLQNNPQPGEAATVEIHGITKALLSGTVTPGAKLATDTSGKLKVATTGQYIVATALQAGTSGSVIAVLLRNEGPHA